ncbi:MAG: DNA methyltransferase [Gemmatimonadota bacterium]
MNRLYYGDNLDVLRRHVPDESVDLVYLDPPFKSNQSYNVLFREHSGSRSAAQIKAFEDTWRWDQEAARSLEDVIEAGGQVAQAMRAFRTLLGDSDMMAYLAMMAPRLVELRRVLKTTGSIYLHCDPTASHYLKLLMDAIFGPQYFLSEIIWKRTHAHGSAQRFAPIHDTLLLYSRSDNYVWRNPRSKPDPDYIAEKFKKIDESSGRRFQDISLTGAGVRAGESGTPWRGYNPTSLGRHWALPASATEELSTPGASVQERLDFLDETGRIYWPRGRKGFPRLKHFADQVQGASLPDVWADIAPINAKAAERLGYPTQKPESLLERVIKASSHEGDLVLDPFCGCGTAVSVAHRLNRRWIGIDITHLAIGLIRHRLRDAFGDGIAATYEVVGEPTSLPDAEKLAGEDPYQFQWWALGLVGARPVEQKKGADKGIDGRLYFHDEPEGGKTKQIILSVKAGGTSVAHVRDLRGVIERESAQIGVLLSMQEPTAPMRGEAASAGFYDSSWGTKYPRLQVLTIQDLLDDRKIDYPPSRQVDRTFRKAPRVQKAAETQLEFGPDSN